MFVDEARIFVAGGPGGDGANVMHREKYIAFGGPSGGSGGRGGSVYLVATRNHKMLQTFRGKVHFKAEKGTRGGKQDRTGRRGADLEVQVPIGTLVREDETGALLADLAEEGQRFLVARGGRGGRGNKALVTEAEPLPRWAEKGTPGVERWIRLELKVMADVGLVGLPNAGKSTFLSVVSNARPKIAAYPFTTLEPQLGVVMPGKDWGGDGFVVADIPGLVEGAHEGTGLGDRFLRHVERTRVILHLVDVSGMEGRDPLESYRCIRRELELHHPDLAAREEILVATKMDLPESQAGLEKLEKKLKRKVHSISSPTSAGVEDLLNAIRATLAKLPEHGPITFEPERQVFTLEAEGQEFEVTKEDADFWVVSGPRVQQLIATHSLDDPESLRHMDGRLRALGVYSELARLGCQEGHTVRLGDFLFDYFPEPED